MANPVHRIRQFYNETLQEIKKCAWPPRDELVESTGLVIVAVILVTAFIFAIDTVSRQGIEAIINIVR